MITFVLITFAIIIFNRQNDKKSGSFESNCLYFSVCCRDILNFLLQRLSSYRTINFRKIQETGEKQKQTFIHLTYPGAESDDGQEKEYLLWF